jgi:hypothetical protein
MVHFGFYVTALNIFSMYDVCAENCKSANLMNQYTYTVYNILLNF